MLLLTACCSKLKNLHVLEYWVLVIIRKLGLKVLIIYDKYCNMSASKYAYESTNSSWTR
jgi:hypothetical protein